MNQSAQILSYSYMDTYTYDLPKYMHGIIIACVPVTCIISVKADSS